MGLLDNILGGGGMMGRAPGSRGISPMTLALLGTLAYRTLKGKGRLADMLGTAHPQGDTRADAQGAGHGGLGDLLGAGAISDGLANLVNRFRQNGHGPEAESWISRGANSEMSPQQLEEALGEERVAWLEQQTGLSRAELLAGLSRSLPDAVDKLTPEGRIPEEHEVRRLM